MLGLLCPDGGTSYDCRLQLQVRNSVGEAYSASVDMNETLTDIINLYAGELPADETIEVNIGRSPEAMNGALKRMAYERSI